MVRFAVTPPSFFQTGCGRKRKISTASTPAKTARMVYSLRMKVSAPARIRPAMRSMVLFSFFCCLTHTAR